ncbi:alanine racemase [Candidatus Oleimmundimicrobium sp.]|uniref:alanine racemase n=1 Tax=Candidatus Oleimmundimicrobium sp. TaxID=3060597 RepID=UPI002727A8F8|nr:alanine racemase [Candidatus Oleimmundimicrobium sp.]MDO8886020.1 alanine racemase [Candidatus Oleimmundimicrobium sp.]
MRPVWAEIDLSAIKKNISLIKAQLKQDTLLMAVVKANGYGHGDVEVSKTALGAGANRLGVASAEEGVRLRKAEIKCPIQILSEIPPSSAKLVIENELIPTVCSKRVVDELLKEAKKLNKKVSVHVKVDTGMNRIGVFPEETLNFLNYIKTLNFIEVEGIFTHFAMAGKSPDYTKAQFEKFTSLISNLEDNGCIIPIKHAANSAATILMPETHLDMVRVGISIYGLHPTEATKDRIALSPALRFKARVSFIKTISAGEGVSYGHSYRAKNETRIATVPLGYADGYSRLLSNKSSVLLRGDRFPVVGNICMDQFMVDVGNHQAEVDDEVVLIGSQGEKEIMADELAKILGTINYEVVCMISGRVPRRYLSQNS